MIILDSVSKRFGSFLAVDNVSLQVAPGEILGFLGVNGAGKTTTLRMITGVTLPTSGSITLGNYDMRTEPERAKLITGYIPDRPYLYPKLTATEFLSFMGSLYRVPTSLLPERADELLSTYGLYEWKDELIEQFSHGMKQRLATAAALIAKPQILIIDEPMVGLDPHGAQHFKDSLRQFAKQGMTILLSTHSLNVAEELSHRVAIIDSGRILTIGTLDELKEQAENPQAGLEELFLHLTDSNIQTHRTRIQ
jgi:ABC-2 type transport system ATP-binding protein